MTAHQRMWFRACALCVFFVASAGHLLFAASDTDDLGGDIGHYAAQESAPDFFTTTLNGVSLVVDDGTAAPERAFDQGKVHLVQRRVTTAEFIGRSTGWGCLYTVWGRYPEAGSVPGEPGMWTNKFEEEDTARIVLEVNAEGDDDNIVWYGLDGGTLTITVLGGSAAATYTVTLATAPDGSEPGEVGFEDNNLPIHGDGGTTTIGLEGLYPGYGVISGSAPNAVPGTVNFAVAKVDIKRDNTVITGTTSDVMVGQKVSLSGVVTPASLQNFLSPKEWVIPGDRIKNYKQSKPQGQVTNLAASDLNGSGANFYWIAGGNNLAVLFRINLPSGIGVEKKATFNVLRPTATLTCAPTTDLPPLCVDALSNHHMGEEWMHYGATWKPFPHDVSPGISWHAKVQAPAIGTGEIAFVQVVKGVTDATVDDGTNRVSRQTSAGKFALDSLGDVQYAGKIESVVGGGNPQVLTANDSPGTQLIPLYKKVQVERSFRTFLMYKPDGSDSIWVTLRVLDWIVNGTTIKVLLIWQPATNVNVTTNDPGSQDAIELPTWDKCYQDLPWAFLP